MEYQERKWVWGFAVVVMVATTIPYILALFNQGENWQFSGFLLGVEDGNSYIAKMLAGANGDWLFRTPYTNFPQQGVLAFFPYLLLGKLTAGEGQHAQLIALFHIYRFIAGCLMIVATYDFTAIFIEKVFFRKLSTILISIGGGFGWLVVLGLNRFWANGMPLEFYSPETFGFLSLYGLPHLALGRACLLWGIVRCV